MQRMGFLCLKCTLLVIIYLVLIMGVTCLGLGIWYLSDPNIQQYLDIIKLNSSGSFSASAFTYSAVMLLTGGILAVFVSIGGLIACLKEKAGWLHLFAWLILLLVVCEIVFIVFLALFISEAGSNLQSSMVSQVKTQYNSNTTIRTSWDVAQTTLKCCGANGPSDYRGSVWHSSSDSWTGGSRILEVPTTCCVLKAPVYSPTQAEVANLTSCQSAAAKQSSSSQSLHTNGCHEGVMDWINTNSIILIVLASVALLMQIVCVVFVCILMRKLRCAKRLITPVSVI